MGSGTANKMTTKQHGRWMYNRGACECDICHDDYLAYKREAYHNAKLKKEMTPHGTVRGYNHYGCRCLDCFNAYRKKNGNPAYDVDPRSKPKLKSKPKSRNKRIRNAKPAIKFPTLEERANRKIEWAGIAL